jgi:hypothetical protein
VQGVVMMLLTLRSGHIRASGSIYYVHNGGIDHILSALRSDQESITRYFSTMKRSTFRNACYLSPRELKLAPCLCILTFEDSVLSLCDSNQSLLYEYIYMAI